MPMDRGTTPTHRHAWHRKTGLNRLSGTVLFGNQRVSVFGPWAGFCLRHADVFAVVMCEEDPNKRATADVGALTPAPVDAYPGPNAAELTVRQRRGSNRRVWQL
jgi:hypothetical protein